MEIIQLQIQIFLLLIVGYYLTKKGYFDSHTRSNVTQIVLSVALPCSIIMSFQIELTSQIITSTFLVLLISIGIQVFYCLLNLFLYRDYQGSKKINLKYGTMVSNAGFMGMPIAQGVFGNLGLLYASIFLLPQRVFMWSAGLSLYTSVDKKDLVKKVLTHPCIVSIFIGMGFMVLTSYHIAVPAFITSTLKSIGSTSTALSMFVIGGILADVEDKNLLNRDILRYSFIRLIFIPLVILGILRLTSVDILSANVCVLLSAMPAASTTAMLAQRYNQNPEFASQMVFISTLFSLITLPIITFILQII